LGRSVALTLETYEEDLEDQIDGAETEEAEVDRLAWLRNTPFWAISAVLHLLLIVVAITVVRHQEKRKEVEVPITVEVRAPPPVQKPPPYDPLRKRDVKRTPKVPGVIKNKEVQTIQRKIVDEVAADIPKGTSLDNLTNVSLESTVDTPSKGIYDTLGVGGGAAGAYGERWGKGSLKGEGGSEGTEDAVRAALEWLMRHQSPDGSWKAKGFMEQCKKACQSVDAARYGDGKGDEHHDVGITALAMLAFAGYGHTHRDGIFEEYVECLRKAVQFMKKVQVQSNDPNTNGRYGPADGEQWIYNHAIATMAMAELLVMSNDIIGLKSSVTDAVKLCLHAQNTGPAGPSGWRYGIKPGENDTSVTGWMVLALKTAKNARIDIPKEDFQTAFAGALNWFNKATASNGKTGYMAPGDEGSRLNEVYPEPYPFSKELSCMTAVGVLCRLFAGEARGSQAIRDGIKILMKHTPRWQEQKGRALSTINMYYWYYGSYALFQYGGPDWKRWNEDMKKVLLESQRQGQIDEDGSWDPIDEWGAPGGRVYSTAICAMTLEVYYRFMRLQGKGF
jgi:hypothetical protein